LIILLTKSDNFSFKFGAQNNKPNKMRIPLALSFLLVLNSSVFSQGLQIYLDAGKGKTVYVSGKDTLSRPSVKRGEPIILYLVNYNNYLYEVEVEELQQQVTYFSTGIDTSQTGFMAKSAGGGSAFDLISTIMNPAGLMGLGSLAGGQLSLLGRLPGGRGFAGLDEAEMQVSGELETIESKYKKILESWARTESNLQSIQTDVERLVNGKAMQAMAFEEIRKLQYNPSLSTSQIKELSEEYLKMVFANTPSDEIDMAYLWKIHQKGQNIALFLKDLEVERANYLTKLEEIRQLSLGLSPLKTRIRTPALLDAYEQIDQSVKSALVRGEQEVKRLDTSYEDLKNLAAQFGEEDLQQLLQLRYIYEEIATNEFSYSYQTTAKEDLTSLTVKLNPKDDLPTGIRVTSRKLAAYEVPTRGGLKINGSIGLGFGQFFTRPQSYYVRDSVILADQQDSFVPYLASFLHFYNYRPAQLAFGGSFGVGIPVFNAKSDQSVSFFLGPSVFLGGAQRITLTGGILGARVEALGNGYKEGDVLDNPFTGVPTIGRYQLGYFIGVSINVIGK
jgi:hypothetical protein